MRLSPSRLGGGCVGTRLQRLGTGGDLRRAARRQLLDAPHVIDLGPQANNLRNVGLEDLLVLLYL